MQELPTPRQIVTWNGRTSAERTLSFLQPFFETPSSILLNISTNSLSHGLVFIFHTVKYISHTVVFISHSVGQRIHEATFTFMQGYLTKCDG